MTWLHLAMALVVVSDILLIVACLRLRAANP
jgi:hypothetical protein